MNALYFSGQWGPLSGFSAAFLLALGSFVWYRHGLRRTKKAGSILLPLLRAGAIFLLVLMLTGPTVRYRKTTEALTRLLILLDGSQSMGVTDPEMDVIRKLAIGRALHWLPSTTSASHLEKVAANLSSAIQGLRNVLLHPQVFENKLSADLDAFSHETQKAIKGLEQNTLSTAEEGEVERDIIGPLKKLRSRSRSTSTDLVAIPKELSGVIDATIRFQMLIAQKAKLLAGKDAGGERKISGVLSQFDQTTRTERIRKYLLDGGETGLLSRLNATFNIDLLAIENDGTRLLWSSQDGIKRLPSSLPNPESKSTNLASSLLERIDRRHTGPDGKLDERIAAVLFSDGRHNANGSPLAIAKLLGDRGIPLFCIGVGSDVRPADLAVVKIDAPQTVFFEDRVSGSVSIKDDMPPGLPVQLKIAIGEKDVWEKSLITSQRGVLKIPFDFSIKEFVSQKIEEGGGSNASFALPLEASLSVLPQEREIRNNTARFTVRATTGKRKLLILDGRPRWESRYVRNLFERDPQWQVNALLNDPGSNQTWARGKTSGTFPSDEETLFQYDTIIFGEVPPRLLSETELQLISNFVSIRGGGLFFLDGPREVLPLYNAEAFTRLFPVNFQRGADPAFTPAATSMQLTDRGAAVAALRLEENSTDPNQTWGMLPAPQHFTQCAALPGTEVLLEFMVLNKPSPALVLRRYGAGQVAYMASDETWRWRNEFGGKYQDRFWSQIINALGEPSFSATDDQIALDTDVFSYPPSFNVPLRARVRDGKSRNSLDVTLWRDGTQHSTVRLVQDPDRPETFSGRTVALESGTYDFGIADIAGSPRLRFEVAPPHTGELSELTLNNELLAQMADASQGRLIHEENTPELANLLSPLKTGQAVDSEIYLWQGYGWFCAILLLLTLEWSLRKRFGLI